MSRSAQQGNSLILVVAIIGVLSTLVVGLMGNVLGEHKFSSLSRDTERSFQIAEAGINYYTWYLNHFEDDWEDGQPGISGPYTHSFEDGDGNVIGYFELTLIPPATGSTIGTVRSKGVLNADSERPREIEARIGVPSLARYSFLTNSDVWFGDTESVDGQLHSNGGIRFDGTGNDLITSAKETYSCQPHHGCASGGETKDGIWGIGGPDSLWEYPVPAIDFDQISGDLASLEDLGNDPDGLYLPEIGNPYSGYYLILDDNNTAAPGDDTVEIYRVRRTWSDWGVNMGNEWENYEDRLRTIHFFDTEPMPDNGVIFVDDKLWIEGETSSRVTIAAAHFPEDEDEYRDIVIVDDLTYYAQDGSAVIGLIAQGEIRVPINSPNNLEIDGVLLAQKGSVYRPYFSGDTNNTITTYGSTISNGVWTWSWVNGGGSLTSGYNTTNSNYDPALLYGPPPYYPTTGTYEVLSWQEVLP